MRSQPTSPNVTLNCPLSMAASTQSFVGLSHRRHQPQQWTASYWPARHSKTHGRGSHCTSYAMYPGKENRQHRNSPDKPPGLPQTSTERVDTTPDRSTLRKPLTQTSADTNTSTHHHTHGPQDTVSLRDTALVNQCNHMTTTGSLRVHHSHHHDSRCKSRTAAHSPVNQGNMEKDHLHHRTDQVSKVTKQSSARSSPEPFTAEWSRPSTTGWTATLSTRTKLNTKTTDHRRHGKFTRNSRAQMNPRHTTLRYPRQTKLLAPRSSILTTHRQSYSAKPSVETANKPSTHATSCTNIFPPANTSIHGTQVRTK